MHLKPFTITLEILSQGHEEALDDDAVANSEWIIKLVYDKVYIVDNVDMVHIRF